jgi:hypothetical protein
MFTANDWDTHSVAAIVAGFARRPGGFAASGPRPTFIHQREASQRHAGEAEAEFLQRRAACD